MCADGVDLGWSCRLCGKPLLSCWDDGPSISWHMNAADAMACTAAERTAAAPTPPKETDAMWRARRLRGE